MFVFPTGSGVCLIAPNFERILYFAKQGSFFRSFAEIAIWEGVTDSNVATA